MNIEDCIKGKRVRINLGDGTGNHYARIDSVQDGLLDGEQVVLVQVLGELKVVSPDCLEKIKRPKKRV